jgi:hypothetical protein
MNIYLHPSGVKKELKNDYIWEFVPYTPNANTLFYLNLNQTDWVFTDAMLHSTTNYWVTYNANWVKWWCWYNNWWTNVIQSLFNSWEGFPSNFTIMWFMKPSGSHTYDHNKWICLGDASNKRAFYIWFATNNSSVVFGCMRLWIWWYEQTSTPSSWNILNERHHYAMTYNWNTMIWYIDGIQKFTYNISWNWSGNVSLV